MSIVDLIYFPSNSLTGVPIVFVSHKSDKQCSCQRTVASSRHLIALLGDGRERPLQKVFFASKVAPSLTVITHNIFFFALLYVIGGSLTSPCT